MPFISPAWSNKREPYVAAPEPPAPAGPHVPYAELHVHSNFSFLDGASSPETLVEEASRLQLGALALTDHDGLYGAVRMAVAGDVPLIPVALWGPQRLWTKGRPRRLFQRGVPVTILVGEPMYPKRGDDYAKATDDLRERLSELLEKAQREYPELPRPGEEWWQPAYLGGSAPTP